MGEAAAATLLATTDNQGVEIDRGISFGLNSSTIIWAIRLSYGANFFDISVSTFCHSSAGCKTELLYLYPCTDTHIVHQKNMLVTDELSVVNLP